MGSELKALEKRLRESEAFNRLLVEGSRDCIKVLDPDAHLLQMNTAAKNILVNALYGFLSTAIWMSAFTTFARRYRQRAARHTNFRPGCRPKR